MVRKLTILALVATAVAKVIDFLRENRDDDPSYDEL